MRALFPVCRWLPSCCVLSWLGKSPGVPFSSSEGSSSIRAGFPLLTPFKLCHLFTVLSPNRVTWDLGSQNMSLRTKCSFYNAASGWDPTRLHLLKEITPCLSRTSSAFTFLLRHTNRMSFPYLQKTKIPLIHFPNWSLS